jgi:prevent-host-death family protein
MPKTQVRPSRDLRNSYREMVKLLEQRDHIIITNNGVGEAVLIGIKDYEEYEQFLHRRFINEELQKTKISSSDPNVKLHDTTEVFSNIERTLERHGL